MADFDLLDPSLTSDALTLQARQSLASQLMGVGAEMPSPTGMVGKVVPRYGAANYLAKVGQMLAGAYMQKQNIGAARDLAAKRMAETQNLMQPTPAPVTENEASQAVAAAVPGGGPPDPARVADVVQQGANLTQPSQYNPQGLDPAFMARWARQNPDQYGAYLARLHAPNDELLKFQQDVAAGGLPRAAAISKMVAGAYNPVHAGLNVGPTGEVQFETTPASPQANATVAPTGQVISQELAPGTSAIQVQEAANTASGASLGGTKHYIGKQGQEVTEFAGGVPRVPGAEARPGPSVPPPPPPGAGAPPPATTPPPAPKPRTTVPPPAAANVHEGPSPFAQDERKTFQGLYQNEESTFDARQSAVNSLQQAINLMHSPYANAGAGSSAAARWASMVAQFTGNSRISNQVEAYQELRKYVSNATAFIQSGLGGGTDAASRDAQRAGLPDVDHMNLPALEKATRYVAGQIDAGLDRTKYLRAKGSALNDPDAVVSAYKGWNSAYDPEFYRAKWSQPLTAVPAPAERVNGQTYNINGKVVRWHAGANGGWEVLNQAQ